MKPIFTKALAQGDRLMALQAGLVHGRLGRRRFIQLAHETSHPVIVHTRDAEADTIRILREEDARSCGGIIHCFSGTQKLAT